MDILITGGAGFIGTCTKKLLKEHGHNVILLDNLRTGSKQNIDDNDTFICGDINDVNVFSELKGYDIDTIIHLAAQTSVPFSVKEPLIDMEQNIEGTIKVIELAKMLKVKRFIFASTAAVYGDTDNLPIQEEMKLNPTSPYGISKMTAERYVEILCELYGIHYVILRYANVYGPKQSEEGEGGVIKIFIDKILKGESPVIFGEGEHTRDYIYVEDIARAHFYALKAPKGIYNISTNSELKVLELLNIILQETGKSLSPIFEEPREGDIFRSVLDNGSFKEKTGWEPKYSIEEGISKTIGQLK